MKISIYAVLINVLMCVKFGFHILKNKNNISQKLMFVYICNNVKIAVSYSPFRFITRPVIIAYHLVRISSDPAPLLGFIWILICRGGVRTMCYTKSWNSSGTAGSRSSLASHAFRIDIMHTRPT